MPFQFDDLMISESENYSIGLERTRGTHFISVVIADGFADQESHFQISEEEFYLFLEDPGAGQAFARRCRAGEEAARLYREGPGVT